MPHVALIFEFPTTNGGENSMLSNIDQLQRNSDWSFTAIIPGNGRLQHELSRRQVECIEWRLRSPEGQRLPLEQLVDSLTELVNSIKPDLAHANSLSMSRILGRATGNIEVPCSGHIRDIIKLSRAAVVDLNMLDWTVPVSEATRAFHVGRDLDASRATVIYNGLPASPSSRQSEVSFRDVLHLDADARLILNAGQLGLRKSQEVLLEAFEQVADRFPDTHLVLAGERNSSKLESVQFESRLHELSQTDRLRGRVHFPGFVPQLSMAMHQFSLLVHAARQEPLGRVLIEAAAASLPIIATDVGGTREIIEDQHSGLLVPRDDKTAMADAMTRLLSDTELAKSLADNARLTAIERFSIERSANFLTAGWQRLLGDSFPESSA